MTEWLDVPLRRLVTCLDGRRIPLNSSERADIPGEYPYWGANGIVDTVGRYLFDEPLVLLGEDGAPFGDPLKDVAFRVDGRVWINNHIHVLRPSNHIDPRFLTYALNSVDWPRYISGSTREKLTQDDMARARLPTPRLATQQVIAGYLDAETARITALIENKQHMAELIQSRFWTAFVDHILRLEAPHLPMRRALNFITDGPFGSAFTSDDYSDDGAAVVRLGNIGFAEYRPTEQAFISLDLYKTFLRHRVLPGDVLIAGLGDPTNHPGRACVAPDLGPAIVKGKCFCARVDTSRAEPEYLALVLSSPYGAGAVGAYGRGSTRSMINLEIVKDISLPFPDIADQRKVIDSARASRHRTASLVAALDEQIVKLKEHRHSLITAAVTGQIDIPGVAA